MTRYVFNVHMMKYPEQEVGIPLTCATADAHYLKFPLKILPHINYVNSPQITDAGSNFIVPYCKECL